MEDCPKISIIIPTCNSSQTIKDCLDSVLSQTFTCFEVLIMDGISTDNTVEMVEAYNDERIKIYSEKDNGVYDAMNKGIDIASGEWLYFLGSDDILCEGILSDVSEHLTSAKEQNISVLYGNVLIDGATGWAKDKQIYDGYYSLSKLLAQNISHQAIFYRSCVFEKMRYNTKYKICADWDIAIRCFSEYNLHYIDKVVAVFRAGGYSSYGIDDEFKKERWQNAVDYFGFKVFRWEFRVYYLDFNQYVHLFSKYFIIKIFYYLYAKYKTLKKRIKKFNKL